MGTQGQDRVCAFARDILAVRTGETIAVTERPEVVHRSSPAVEELWESPSRRYAVEHTRLESFDGQLENEVRLRRMILPVRDMLAGRLPGTYVLTVLLSEAKEARVPYEQVHQEIGRLTLEKAAAMGDGETIVLESDRLTFPVQLRRRHGNRSQVFVHCAIVGERDALRLTRVRRAFEDKCPKLAAWSVDGRASVLVLEANDIQLSNVFLVWEAVKDVIAQRTDVPDTIIFVETDGSPMYGWVLKDGANTGDAVPTPNGTRCYTEGQLLPTVARF